MPQFEKDENDLANKFPEFAKEDKIKGCVVFKFVVDEKWHVFGEHIKESDHSTLDVEALRVVRNIAQWTPAILDGKPVMVLYDMAINFKNEIR